ncbi:MAG: tetratricopeptide repeat protein [Planctomycetota bacterium]|jgi:tetratricopeptide (TPR) repeat protein
MTGKRELLVWAFLICGLLLNGCEPVEHRGPTEGPAFVRTAKPTEPEQEGELLKRINKRFENPQAHFQLGQLYHAQQRWDKADYHYKTALSFDPVLWSAQAAIVKMLEDQGETAKSQLAAEIYMNQVAAVAQRSLDLGVAFQEQEAYDYALACYRQALALRPKSTKLQAKIYKHIGYYYLSQKDDAQAEQYFIRSFQLDRYQSDVGFELGRLGREIKTQSQAPKRPPGGGQEQGQSAPNAE